MYNKRSVENCGDSWPSTDNKKYKNPVKNLRVHGIRHNNKYKIMSKTYPKSRVHCRYEITINQNYVKNKEIKE